MCLVPANPLSDRSPARWTVFLIVGCFWAGGVNQALAQNSIDFVVQPSVITQCAAYGLGRATIWWSVNGPGPVKVLVGPSGAPMTGPEPPSGSAQTGDWVGDGLSFVLADANGNQLAQQTASVACSPFSDPVPAALSASSYFPLQVGNEWVYRTNSRIATSTYAVRRVDRAEVIGGTAWFVLQYAEGVASTETLFRNDEQGRVYTLNSNGNESLYFDPTTLNNPAATLQTRTTPAPFQGTIGTFDDALSYTYQTALTLEGGFYVRGLGLASSSSQMLTGSSGGFLESYDLVSARIAGNLIFPTPATSVRLGVESDDLNVTGQKVTNCALPCYYAACGLGGGVPDPPGTYKPCFQARVRLEGTVASPVVPDSGNRTLVLDFLDAAQQVVLFHSSQTLAVSAAQPDVTVFQQIPLFTSTPSANGVSPALVQPFAAGEYWVRATAQLADGKDSAATTVPVWIR
jgi:hypothetical protein